jgi:excisionase family DNA binding protein
MRRRPVGVVKSWRVKRGGDAMRTNDVPPAGMTVREVARHLRVSPDRVRAWIRSGAMGAINTSETRCGRPRFVVLPHHLADFERGRAAATVPPKPARRRKRTSPVDYYPD